MRVAVKIELLFRLFGGREDLNDNNRKDAMKLFKLRLSGQRPF